MDYEALLKRIRKPPRPKPTLKDARNEVRRLHRQSPKLKKISVQRMLKHLQRVWEREQEEKPWG